MNPIELLYPLFKLQNSTNTIVYLFVIVLLGIINCYLVKRYDSTIVNIFVIISFLFSFALVLNVFTPDNIKTTVKETSYKTVSPEWEQALWMPRMRNLAQTTIAVDALFTNDDKLIYVYKYVDKYEVDPETSKYTSEYHKKSLVKMRVMPVTVTTQWHDIKEVQKDMYIIERTYKVEPDLKKFNQDIRNE